jgi:diguanylate cyclase (GGDEF)-like protein
MDLAWLFSTDGFMPHGMCYLWRPGILAVHVGADSLIALAYSTIPVTLLYFVRKRPELHFSWIFLCFAVLIVACGASHVMEIVTIWFPLHWLAGGVKVITALASVMTAILLVKLVPAALRFPTPSALLEANEKLARNNVQLSTLIDNIQSGVLVEDEQRRIQHANHELCSIFDAGTNPSDLMGCDGAELMQRVKARFAQPEQFVAGIERLLQSRERVSNELVGLVDGRMFERDYVPMLSDGIYRGQLWAYRNVTRQERDRALLEQSSVHNRRISENDELTGLHNRRGFLLAAEQHPRTVHRDDRQSVLFYFDLNGLKKINDALGHDMGDQAIRDMAALLRKTFRASDILGRLGGDEFVVLASMDPGDGTLTSMRLRKRMAAFNAHGGRSYSLGPANQPADERHDARNTASEPLESAAAPV